MPTLEEIASTIEERQETTDPVISKAKFKLLKKNIKEQHGLEWEDVSKWHYVGGFKHPDREHGCYPCDRTKRLEKLFKLYYPKTGDKWLAYFKMIEARPECYCETEIYWQYIIVKDLETLNVMPYIYNSKKRPRDYLIVGCECVKRFINMAKKCVKCKAIHKNSSVPYCNDCRTDGKWEIFCCDYCNKRGQVKLPLDNIKKRRCSACIEKPKPKIKKTYFMRCKYCKKETQQKDVKKKLWDTQFRTVEGIICKYCCVNCGGLTLSQKQDNTKHYLNCYKCSQSIYSHQSYQ